MKDFSQASSRDSLAPMTAPRTWKSRNLCRVEICGRQGGHRLRDELGLMKLGSRHGNSGGGERLKRPAGDSIVDALGHPCSNTFVNSLS